LEGPASSAGCFKQIGSRSSIATPQLFFYFVVWFFREQSHSSARLFEFPFLLSSYLLESGSLVRLRLGTAFAKLSATLRRRSIAIFRASGLSKG
jgi:hypothetical protein